MTEELAYRKIDARLRAYGLDQLSVRHRVAQDILEQAKAFDDGRSLELRASDVFDACQRRITSVFEEVSEFQNDADAILTMQRADANAVWMAALESPELLQDVVRIYATKPLTTGPALTRSSLGAPRIRFDMIEATANGTFAAFSRWPKLRITGLVCLLTGLSAAIISIAR